MSKKKRESDGHKTNIISPTRQERGGGASFSWATGLTRGENYKRDESRPAPQKGHKPDPGKSPKRVRGTEKLKLGDRIETASSWNVRPIKAIKAK